jgi:hypothetical protein
MNTKCKIVVYATVTLLLGILMGALLNRALVQKRIKGILEMRNIGLLTPRPEKELEPLSPEQDKQIRAILQKHVERLAEIHQRMDREIQAAFKSLANEINPILTPRQREQFERMVPGPPRFPDRFRSGSPLMKGPGQPTMELEALKKELDLSEDQAKKIEEILEEFWDQMRSRRERQEPSEGFDLFRQAEEKKIQEIEKVLTDNQKERYRQIQKMRPPAFEAPRRPGMPFIE